MNLTFKCSENLLDAAKYTFENMSSYYQRYSVDWDLEKIVETTSALDNFDIRLDDEIIGVFRTQLEGNYLHLRDLQVKASHQNRGVGAAVLNEIERSSQALNIKFIKLKVFKISPALELYKRNGFTIEDEDDRFFYMEAVVF